MSKMYEALQLAKRDRPALQQLPPPVDPAQVDVTFRLDFDSEMLGLYHALDNIFPGLNQKTILFLGAKGGEGASTVVSSLARVAVERFHRKVAILDTNTLHPTQHQLFGVSPTVGWDDVLRGTELAETVIYQTNVKGLFVAPVSSARAGTVQVIDATGMEGFFGALRESVDLMLIDSAPAMAFPDNIVLSRQSDGVVLVIEAESTRGPVAETVCQQITSAGGRVIGTVFNKRRYYIPEFVYKRL
jgi:protein-tyrosine kinase